MASGLPSSKHVGKGSEDGSGAVWGRVWFVLRFAAVTAYVLLIAIGLATAQVTDRVSFEIEKRVIVWAGTPGNQRDAAGFAAQPQGPATPALSRQLVMSGQLIKASASDRHAVADHELETAFFVASNAAFNIKAHWTGSDRAAANISMSMGVDVTEQSHGRAAQHPAPLASGDGFTAPSWSLGELTTPRIVFEGHRKTAARRGSIGDQSVRFNARFSAATASEALEQAVGEVVFTVFCP